MEKDPCKLKDLAGMGSFCRCRKPPCFNFGTWQVSSFIRWLCQKQWNSEHWVWWVFGSPRRKIILGPFWLCCWNAVAVAVTYLHEAVFCKLKSKICSHLDMEQSSQYGVYDGCSCCWISGSSIALKF